MRFSKTAYYGFPIAAVVFFAVSLLASGGLLPSGISWTKAILFCLVWLAAMGLGLRSYRYADEVMMERNKSAMLWGSQIGLAVAVPLMVGLGWGLLPLPDWPPHPTQPLAFVEGMAFMYFLQMAGFGVVKTIRLLQGR